MKRYCLIAAATAALVLSVPAQAAEIVAVDEQNNLVNFDSATPSTFTRTIKITGTTATLLALDVRDSNMTLYGLGDDFRLYTINQLTGLASAVGGALALTGTNFGFDFNTAVDALRIVSNDGSNYVVNPNTGTLTTVATPVFFVAGDPNNGQTPVVTANGYRHGTGTQFAISTSQDVLVTQGNNTGTLTTVGSLGVPVGPRTSFDIGFDGVGYLADTNNFYTVDLTTGRATFVGNTARSVFGITALQGAVPEPATWMMMMLGMAGVGFSLRRKNKQTLRVRYS